jgi:hypothetical protein
MGIQSYRKLEVWKLSTNLAEECISRMLAGLRKALEKRV